MPTIRFASALLLVCTFLPAGFAADPPLPDGTAAATRQIATFKHPDGLKVQLWAAEPMLASPVAICLDEKNRVFVAEEYRFNRGTEENRSRPFLLEDDLQIQTLDDRLKMFQKWSGKFEGGMDWFRKHSDQVRLLEDRTGGGRATHSTVFADGFNDVLDGLAAGVIARDGNIYLTCIPNLWLLKDTKGTGKADVRQSLLRGFGVNCGFLGHDLHGLAWGPDGKLYFSVGDRGFHVKTKEGTVLSGPRSGAVFRCNPDGTEFEVIFRGLRNPQELAFDQFGNLFAVDNNCDKGDHSRLVYIVEGGDSGWNMSYQTIPEPYLTGPWHAERMWHLPNKGQPAWIVPPVGKIGAGPSGFVFTSGLSLPERYRNKFFYCNYTGNGGVESFGVVPQGAGFAMVDHHDFLKPIMATDVDFGYDGKMYVSDFVNLDWSGKSLGGRIYTLFDPKRLNDPIVQETKRLFAEGFSQRGEAELAKLLEHADLRVRQRAQFTLAERGEKSIKIFEKVATLSSNQLARLHAIWGLGQIGRAHAEACQRLATLLQDPDAEVRAQSARVIGDCRWSGANGELLKLINDNSPRVRYFATMALGKLKVHAAIKPIAAMLKANDNEDPFLRHAGVTALASIGDANAVLGLVYYGSSAVRLASLLALRRMNDPRLLQFLGDGVFEIATEAARAVNDLPMEANFPALARLLDRYSSNSSLEAEPLLRRAINANLRLGRAENAERVARFAASEKANPTMRAEALAALADWAKPSPRDRVTGFWRPLPPRDPEIVRGVLQEWIPAILARTSGKMQADAVRLIAKYEIKIDDAAFFGWVGDTNKDPSARVAALHLLASRKYPQLDQAIDVALHDASPRLRAEARSVLASVKPESALPQLVKILNDSSAAALERQSALALLAKTPGGEKNLDDWVGRFKTGKVPRELMVDLIEILKESADAKRKQLATEWEAKQSPSDSLAKFRIALYGGDAERGRSVFVGHAAAQCMRCHKIHGEGGDAGPDLSKVVERNPKQTREYLLESLIVPNAKIAAGYANVSLTLSNGKIAAGLLKGEDDKSVTLLTPNGKTMTVAKSEIEERTPPTSAMPEMGRVLSPREMRDLIEYLMSLK